MDNRDAARWESAQEGAELLREGDYDEAALELERVVLADPDNEYALYFLGSVRFHQQKWQQALKAYVTALEKKPEYLGAIVGAGHVLRMMGELDRAIRMGRQVLDRDERDADALYLLGLAHFQRGDRAEAHDYLGRFLETNPEIEPRLEVQGLLQTLDGQVLRSEEGDGSD